MEGTPANALLEELARQGQQAREQAPQPAAREGGARPPRMRYTHEAMADALVANPGISQGQLAAQFGYTPAWVSTVINSDAFQALLARRRSELVDPEVALTVRERLQAMTVQGLKVMQEKLSKPADQVDDSTALKAIELGTKGLGLGAQGTVLLTSEERLKALAHRLVAMQGGAGGSDVVDVQAREVPGA